MVILQLESTGFGRKTYHIWNQKTSQVKTFRLLQNLKDTRLPLSVIMS